MRVLRAKEVQDRLGGCSRMQLYRLEKSAQFPIRIHIGRNSVGWLEHEVDAWLEARAAERSKDCPAPTS